MDQSICKLTLIYPVNAEDQIVELLLEFDPPLQGFSSWVVDGHGHGFARAQTAELVRGRVKRGMLVAVIQRSRLSNLLDLICNKAKIHGLVHWVEPIDSYGRLSD